MPRPAQGFGEIDHRSGDAALIGEEVGSLVGSEGTEVLADSQRASHFDSLRA
jgi:hypothetical protein